MKPATEAVVPSTPIPAQSRRYLCALLGMLLAATIFEGYDITIFHLCTPDIARTFRISDASIGAIATTVRFGGVLSFFVTSLADRLGRKRVLSVTILCYGFFTLLTALSTGLLTFTIFQSAAQVFLAAEFGVAVTMIGEEFPENWRARAISLLLMVALRSRRRFQMGLARNVPCGCCAATVYRVVETSDARDCTVHRS
jgi:MFS family permease